ncbi:hypothetical protein Hanom_Chr01g00038101 [Helianthus anomalus]
MGQFGLKTLDNGLFWVKEFKQGGQSGSFENIKVIFTSHLGCNKLQQRVIRVRVLEHKKLRVSQQSSVFTLH